jgi:hypothetical protein
VLLLQGLVPGWVSYQSILEKAGGYQFSRDSCANEHGGVKTARPTAEAFAPAVFALHFDKADFPGGNRSAIKLFFC